MKSLNVTLKGVCSDPSIKGEDEVRLRVNPSAINADTTNIGVRKVYNSTPNPKFTIVGEGYFVVNNVNVREVELEDSSYTYIKLALNTMTVNTEISITNAHNINAYIDIETQGAVSIRDIEDISKFATNTTWLELGYFEDYFDVDGNLLSKYTNLQELYLNSANAYGHLANIPSTVKKLRIIYSKITGDISNLPSVIEEFYFGQDSKVYGNLASVPDGIQFIWGATIFSWPSTTSRPTTSKQFGMNYVILGNDLDNMLVNMAACAANANIPSDNKVINVSGNHTMEDNVWQAAVQTLQSAGFTVTLNT